MTVGFTRLNWACFAEVPTMIAEPGMWRQQGPSRRVWSLLWRCGACAVVTALPAAHRAAHELPTDEGRRKHSSLTAVWPCTGCMATGIDGYFFDEDEQRTCLECLGAGRVQLHVSPLTLAFDRMLRGLIGTRS